MLKRKILMSVGLGTAIATLGATDIHADEKGTVTTSVLNVRSGASTSHSIIGKLYKGNTVEILETSNGWHKIKLSSGKTGWCSGNYISKSSTNPSNPSTPESSVSGYGKVTTNGLNVRSGAGTNYSIIGKLNTNDTVKLLGVSNGWYKVELSNKSTGWCSGQYITKVSDPQTPDTGNPSTPEVSISGYGKVTTGTLNVRSGAGTNHSIISKIYRDNVVKLIASSNGWYKVELSNGSHGWVSASYITKVEKPETSNPNPNPGTPNPNPNPEPGKPDIEVPSTNKREAVVNLAKAQLGKPYEWAAQGPNSFDCSGLISYVYKNGANVNLPRTSTEQSKIGTTVNKSELQAGDLLFSSTDGSGNVSHVGIYIGNGEMIHSPKPGQNVETVNINTTYWNNAYLWAKRVM